VHVDEDQVPVDNPVLQLFGQRRQRLQDVGRHHRAARPGEAPVDDRARRLSTRLFVAVRQVAGAYAAFLQHRANAIAYQFSDWPNEQVARCSRWSGISNCRGPRLDGTGNLLPVVARS